MLGVQAPSPRVKQRLAAFGATLVAMTPKVTPEDLAKYNDAAIQLARSLPPGTYRWGALVNTAASMAEVEDDEGGEQE